MSNLELNFVYSFGGIPKIIFQNLKDLLDEKTQKIHAQNKKKQSLESDKTDSPIKRK